MTIERLLAPKRGSDNPFEIIREAATQNQELLDVTIRKMPYSEFIGTSYWFGVSTVAKSNAKMRCQVCNSDSTLHVHHRTYESHGREHSNMHDLVVLCVYCHGLFHGKSRRTSIEIEAPSHTKIPTDNEIVLTLDLINQCRTPAYAFTYATMTALGVGYKPAAGWVRNLIGTIISKELYQQAIDGREVFVKKKRANLLPRCEPEPF